jgi:hypothetical protein
MRNPKNQDVAAGDAIDDDILTNGEAANPRTQILIAPTP